MRGNITRNIVDDETGHEWTESFFERLVAFAYLDDQLPVETPDG
jgi:hypothetical protein